MTQNETFTLCHLFSVYIGAVSAAQIQSVLLCLPHSIVQNNTAFFLLNAERPKPGFIFWAFDVGEILGGKNLVLGWIWYKSASFLSAAAEGTCFL